MVLIGVFTVRSLALGDLRFRFGNFRVETVTAQATDEQRFSVNEPATLVVEDDIGEITVTAGDTDEIVVTVQKTAWGANQAEAEAKRDAIQVSVTQQGDTVRAVYRQPQEVVVFGASDNVKVDFTITVPRETVVSVTSSVGRVSLTGTTGDAELQADFGRVTVTNVTGALTARSNSGEVTATGIQAGEGAINLRSDFGSVTLKESVAGEVTLNSNSGKLELTDIAATGKVTANTDFGSVTVTNVSGKAYDLHSNSGTITAEGVSGALKAHTDFGGIEITEALTVTLDLRTNSGGIDFSGSLGDGPHAVHTDFGAITLKLPEGTALDVDLRTDFGKIKSAFPVTISGNLGEAESTHFTGPINGGGDTLEVSTNSGNIALEIRKP
jgi:hypothetical protein